MKTRIGYGGPREYRHGKYYPGGRVNNGGMTEIERLIHLIASMQILFGSRRGGWLVPVILIGLLFGGWFIYRNYYSSNSALEKAHAMYNSDDTRTQMAAIKEYGRLLEKSDPIEPTRQFLMEDRDLLYQRIIRHQIKYVNGDRAFDTITRAWDEGFTNLRFKDPEVAKFWDQSLDILRKNKSKPANRASTPEKKSRYELIEGID